jgi:chromosome segregation ATPase
MENDQLTQRIEWLDEERRNDKIVITELQSRIAKLEGNLDKVAKENIELSSEITRLSVLLEKIDKFNEALEAHRTEVKKELDTQETRRQRRETEQQQLREVEIENLNKSLAQVNERVSQVAKLEESIRARQDEEARLQKNISDVRKSIDNLRQGEEERIRNVRALEDSNRQEEKRLNDIQGEVAAIRKRTDELRGKMDLSQDGQRKIETRINEMISLETERREGQAAFIEKINTDILERERTWKSWSERFENIDDLADQLSARVQEIETSARTLDQAQNSFEEMSEQISRRTNEITEMQRLGEERFRQEWASFKADDQKRWTNYTLTQEEQHREISRTVEKISEQLTTLDDTLQEIQDIVQYTSEQSEKRIQSLLNIIRDWAAETDRFMSSMR